MIVMHDQHAYDPIDPQSSNEPIIHKSNYKDILKNIEPMPPKPMPKPPK